jgi:branched-chain amino acid transport system ATP-binding protein
MILLTAEALTMRFGGLVAVNDFNLQIEKGEIVGLIGPNGAGKTTVFNMIAGYYTPSEGVIRFRDSVISGLKANRITKAGIARTFQNIRLFSELSVVENVMIGYHCRIRSSVFGAPLRLPLYRREGRMMVAGAMKLLRRSGSRTWPGSVPPPCPTASSGGSSSPGPWPRAAAAAAGRAGRG